MTKVSFPIRVRVPASTSNCGPGFDTLGMALSLYNTVTLVRLEGDGPAVESPIEAGRAMMEQAGAAFFDRLGSRPYRVSVEVEGEVPLARGLGSSVTVRAGMLAGLNAAAGSPLSREDLVGLVTELEGHPDNASAAILGGFCVARCSPETGHYTGTLRFEVAASLKLVVVSPDQEVKTSDSRGLLPSQLPFGETVRSLNSLATVVAAFASGRYEALRGSVTDFVHQPYRLPRIPGAESAIAAGVAAGALTGWLSGSGSSVLCVSHADAAKATAEAMVRAFEHAGVASTARVLSADNEGLQVLGER
jgi:homoserine kinase